MAFFCETANSAYPKNKRLKKKKTPTDLFKSATDTFLQYKYSSYLLTVQGGSSFESMDEITSTQTNWNPHEHLHVARIWWYRFISSKSLKSLGFMNHAWQTWANDIITFWSPFHGFRKRRPSFLKKSELVCKFDCFWPRNRFSSV